MNRLGRALYSGAVVASIGIFLHGALHAQADFDKGYQGYQSFHGTDFDTINLANGNLVLNIPLLSYDQRGGLPPVVIAIHSNSTTFQSSPPVSGGPLDTLQHEVPSGVIGSPWGQPHVMISPGGLTWQENRVTIEKAQLSRFVAIDDSGASHSLAGGIANSQESYLGNIKYSVDGSDLMLTASTSPLIIDRNGNVGGLIDPNGNQIQLKGPCAQPPGSGEFYHPELPSWENYAHGTASATYIVDSIGRVIPNPSYVAPVQTYNCIVDTDTSYYPDPLRNAQFDEQWPTPKWNDIDCPVEPYPAPYVENINGSPVTINNVSEKYYFPGQSGGTVAITFCYEKIAVSLVLPTVQQTGSLQSNPDTGVTGQYETENETWPVLTAAILPNGTSWIFKYDSYGQVSSVTTPTGSVTSYIYGDCNDPKPNSQPCLVPTEQLSQGQSAQFSGYRLACGNPPGEIPASGIPSWPFSNIMSSRLITRRTIQVSAPSSAQALAQSNNLVGPLAWHYQTNIGSGWEGTTNSGQVTVTDPQNNDTVHIFNLIGSPTNGAPLCGPYETDTRYYQGTSQGNPAPTPLREVLTQYTSTGIDHANPTNFSNYIAIGVVPVAVTTVENAGSGGTGQIRQDVSNFDTFGTYQDYKGTAYNFSMGQKLVQCETDWAPLASVSTPPVTPPPTVAIRSSTYSNSWQTNFKHYQANLVDLPSLSATFSGGSINSIKATPTCGIGTTTASQTTFLYDESAYAPGLLGVQTSVKHLLIPVVLPSTANPTSHTYYNSDAMPIQKVDLNGNSTTIIYDPSNGLYPTSIQYPTTGNSVSHSESFNYDPGTGELMHHWDQNTNETSYTYDEMRRPLTITYPPPNGGSELYAYCDIASDVVCTKNDLNPPSFVFNKAITGSVMYAEAGLADTLGRKVETQITSDPDGVTYSDTVYDSLGRVSEQSNPFRSTSGTPPYTTYLYDSLGRKTVQTQQDGSSKQYWCYMGQKTNGQGNCEGQLSRTASRSTITGSWVDFEDETGSDWQHNSDGLGRLTNVMEPSGSAPLPMSFSPPTMQTDYTYDSLNDLASVKQYGGTSSSSSIVQRAFSYDTLSRLIASFNPETTSTNKPASLTCPGTSGLWAGCYSYDNNGNLTSKINNLGVTTTYTYDQLNRVLSKIYSDGMTPTSCYQYDSPSSVTYPIGHLTMEWTQKGACPANSQSSLQTITTANGPIFTGKAILAYDSMDRILTEQQCTLANNCTTTTTPYQILYGYDLGGNLTSYTSGLTASNPGAGNGLLTFTANYYAGSYTTGRLQSLGATWKSSNMNLFTVPSVLTGSTTFGYAPQGALQSATYGNNALTLYRIYDQRLRILSESDTGQPVTSPTSSSATVPITGSEQSK